MHQVGGRAAFGVTRLGDTPAYLGFCSFLLPFFFFLTHLIGMGWDTSSSGGCGLGWRIFVFLVAAFGWTSPRLERRRDRAGHLGKALGWIQRHTSFARGREQEG
jgi:hypothetical protein